MYVANTQHPLGVAGAGRFLWLHRFLRWARSYFAFSVAVNQPAPVRGANGLFPPQYVRVPGDPYQNMNQHYGGITFVATVRLPRLPMPIYLGRPNSSR